MASKILIAIPAYNCIEAIDLTIESCLRQSVLANVLIIDNLSNDGTYEYIVDNYGNNLLIEIRRNSENLGRVGNWNALLSVFKNSNYDFIKFLFTGDELEPNCIEELEKVIAEHPSIAAVASDYYFSLNGIETITRENIGGYLDAEQVNLANLINGGFLGSIISNAYSKNAIGNFQFNEQYVGKTDFDFAVLQNRSAYYINLPLAKSNIKFRKTFFSAKSFKMDCEDAYNRAFWIDKRMTTLTSEQYKQAQVRVLFDFIKRVNPYFDNRINLKLVLLMCKLISKQMRHACLKKIKMK